MCHPTSVLPDHPLPDRQVRRDGELRDRVRVHGGDVPHGDPQHRRGRQLAVRPRGRDHRAAG